MCARVRASVMCLRMCAGRGIGKQGLLLQKTHWLFQKALNSHTL